MAAVTVATAQVEEAGSAMGAAVTAVTVLVADTDTGLVLAEEATAATLPVVTPTEVDTGMGSTLAAEATAVAAMVADTDVDTEAEASMAGAITGTATTDVVTMDVVTMAARIGAVRYLGLDLGMRLHRLATTLTDFRCPAMYRRLMARTLTLRTEQCC
jgi:hypothetical protein